MSEEKVKNVVVEVLRASAIVLPPIADCGIPEEQAGKMLLPGENDLSEYSWEKAKKNPAIRIALRKGELRKIDAKKANPLSRDWNALSDARLSEIVGVMTDQDRIMEIKGEVKTKGAKDICTQRIAQLQAVAEVDNA